MATRTDLISQDPILREAIDATAVGFTKNERVQTFSTHLMALVETILGNGWNKSKERYGSKTGAATTTSIAIFGDCLDKWMKCGEEYWTDEKDNWLKTFPTLVHDFGRTVDAYCASLYQENVGKRQRYTLTIHMPSVATFLKVFFDKLMAHRDVRSGAYFQETEPTRSFINTRVLRESLYELMQNRGGLTKVEVVDDEMRLPRHQRHSDVVDMDMGVADEEKLLKDATMANVERSKPMPEDLEMPSTSDMTKALRELGFPDDERVDENEEPAQMLDEPVEEEEPQPTEEENGFASAVAAMDEDGVASVVDEADMEVHNAFLNSQTDIVAEQDELEKVQRPTHPLPRRSVSYTPSPAASSVGRSLPVLMSETFTHALGEAILRPTPLARLAAAPYSVSKSQRSGVAAGSPSQSARSESGSVKDVRQRMVALLRERHSPSPSMQSVGAHAQAAMDDDIGPDDSASNVSRRSVASKTSRTSSSITEELLNALEKANGQTSIETWLRNSPLNVAPVAHDDGDLAAGEDQGENVEEDGFKDTAGPFDPHGSPKSVYTIEGED